MHERTREGEVSTAAPKPKLIRSSETQRAMDNQNTHTETQNNVVDVCREDERSTSKVVWNISDDWYGLIG